MYEDESKIVDVSLEKEMEKSYLDYSMSVIVMRALPDVRDGLKPVHRRILYAMFENGLSPEKAYRKSADTVGVVLGRYHPHGQDAIYDALVRMAQDFSLRYTLIDGHGNFGSIDGDPPAAYRYTEARLSKMSMNMLTDLDKETVAFVSNYDDRLKEPTVLPSRFPNLLVNGSTGIAVGMATNIPPHNLGEVIDALCFLMKNPDAEIDEVLAFIKGPDFPTGGVIMGMAGLRAAYHTGKGKILLRAKTEIEGEEESKAKIIVTEIPYMVSKSKLLIAISDLVKEKKIEGISDLRDESDRNGLRIVIEIKRGAIAQVVLNQLFKYSQMQETYGIILLALVGGEPKILNIKQILDYYLLFQKEVIINRTKFELKRAEERKHILEGLVIAIESIDEVISLIRSASIVGEAREKLELRFNLTQIQSAAIIAMKLGQLTGLERGKLESELTEVRARIKNLLELLANDAKILALIKEDLLEIKRKFTDGRRTKLEPLEGEVDIEDLIEEQTSVVTLTHFGYIKRQPTQTYKVQKRGGKGVIGLSRKEEDFVEDLFVCSTHDYIFFFTNKGKAYRIKCYQILEGSRVAKGTNIVNLISLEPGEKVTAAVKVENIQSNEFFVMATRKGIIKRTKLIAYQNIRKGGIVAINLDDDDELGWVTLTKGAGDILVATKQGKAIHFGEKDVRIVGRQAKGVRAILMRAEDEVVGVVAFASDDQKIITITENGIGRCAESSKYRRQARGGKGVYNYKVTEATGLVASVKAIIGEDDLIIIKNEGTIIRVKATEIRNMSRTAKGIKLVRVKDGERVVALAKVPSEEITELEDEEVN
ncbi:MAG: DNA gyrase subunit A [Oscillospiraceae bacterium]|jgi:DNA gyrase subunit A|nr:DNA gyrase subunit A [Oscillospiraceae bacterium]